MALFCAETRKDISSSEPLMAAARADMPTFSALSQEVLSRIPEGEKRPLRCSPSTGDDGVDIHAATSEDDRGRYTLDAFRPTKFLYSISGETARRYLPNHYHYYPKLKKE